MRKYLLVTLIATLAMFFSCKSKTNTTTTNEYPDQAYLKNAAAEWDAHFNKRNPGALTSLYSEDIVSMPSNSPSIYGLLQLQAVLNNFFLQNADVQHQTIVEEIQAKDNWALERARYKLSYIPAATGVQVIETGKQVMFRKKLGDRWYIMWEIWNRDSPGQ